MSNHKNVSEKIPISPDDCVAGILVKDFQKLRRWMVENNLDEAIPDAYRKGIREGRRLEREEILNNLKCFDIDKDGCGEYSDCFIGIRKAIQSRNEGMSSEEGVWYLDKNGKAWYLNKNGKAVPMTTNNSGGNMENEEIAKLAFRHTGRSGVSLWNTEFEGNMIAQIVKALDAKDAEIAELKEQVKIAHKFNKEDSSKKLDWQDAYRKQCQELKAKDAEIAKLKKQLEERETELLQEQRLNDCVALTALGVAAYEKLLFQKIDALKKQLGKKEDLLEKFREAFKFYDPYNHRGNRERWESLSGEALALLPKPLNKEVKEKGSEA